MKSVKHYKTNSEKNFDDLVTSKCSWSYKTSLDMAENESLDSLPQGFSSVCHIPHIKNHPDVLHSMNGIGRNDSDEIIENITNISTSLPSSSESIFDNLLSETNKISSQGQMQNKSKICTNNSQKKKDLRTSKSKNYETSSDSGSDDEMVLQSRIFNDTKSAGSYNSDPSFQCHDHFSETQNISNEVEKNDSFIDEISMEKEVVNLKNFNTESCSEILSSEIDREENMHSDSSEMNMIKYDIFKNIAKNKIINKLKTVKMSNGNNAENDFCALQTEDKISNFKKDKKTCRSRNDSCTKRNLRSLKPINYACDVQQYEPQTRISNETRRENNNHFSNSNKCFVEKSIQKLSNEETEMNEIGTDTSLNESFNENRQNNNADFLDISKTSFNETLPTSNKVSEKYDLVKSDNQHKIKICLNVSSEVQFIGNKSEMSGSLSEEDEIAYDFLNGSFDLEKYNLKQHESNVKEQNCSTHESKQSRKKLETTKVGKALSNSVPLKGKTKLSFKKALYTSQNLKSTNKKVANGKTKIQTSIYDFSDDFGKQKMMHAIRSETLNVNQSKVNKRSKNSENHKGTFRKQNQLKDASKLAINKGKNCKEKDLLYDNSYKYCSSTENNLLDKSPKKLTFQNEYFEENDINSQSSFSSASMSRNIQIQAKKANQFGKIKINEAASKLDSSSSCSNSVQNASNKKTGISDGIQSPITTYLLNRNKPDELFYEHSFENEMTIRSPIPKTSPNISIIENTIANINSCASPYMKPINVKCPAEEMSSSDDNFEKTSPILTEYSCEIQKFKSTIYFNGDTATKETCFASKIEKNTLHQNEAKFSNAIEKNKHCIQNKSLDLVINSKMSDSPSSPMLISTNTQSSSYKTNKGESFKKQKNTLIPKLKVASNIITAKNKIGSNGKAKKFRIVDLNKSDGTVSSNADSDISIESVGFTSKKKIMERRNYNLRKRKNYKNKTSKKPERENTTDLQFYSLKTNLKANEVELSSDNSTRSNQSLRKRKNYKNNKKITKKPKRESTTDFQLHNLKEDLTKNEFELLSDNSIRSESIKHVSCTLKQNKSNCMLKDKFTSSYENCGTDLKCILNTSNLDYFKENKNLSSEIEPNEEKILNVNWTQKDRYSKKDHTHKEKIKQKNSSIISRVTKSNGRNSKTNNVDKNTNTELVQKMENSSLKCLRKNNFDKHNSNFKKKKQTYEEYENYWNDLYEPANPLQSLEKCKLNDTEILKKKSSLKQKFTRNLNKDHVLNCTKETSDDDVFSISSFGSDLDEKEVSQKEGSGFLFDVLEE